MKLGVCLSKIYTFETLISEITNLFFLKKKTLVIMLELSEIVESPYTCIEEVG